MRKKIILVVISAVIFLFAIISAGRHDDDDYKNLRNFYKSEEEHQRHLNRVLRSRNKRNSIRINVSVVPSSSSEFVHKIRHHHGEDKKLGKLERCRRYAQEYYYNRQAPVFVPSNCYYNPSRCQSHCGYCPTSNCRRWCPQSCPTFPTQSSPIIRTTTTKPCNCDADGSLLPSCDPKTGHCRCKAHFEGSRCDRCESGYFKADFNCHPCRCHFEGSVNPNCDQSTGQCYCKPGVGGQHCTTCLDKHYGDIKNGCKKCELCNKEGHICHPETGKCVCPSLTIGNKCEKCAKNSWGYEPGIGCKACDCSSSGSTKSQCDVLSGRCTCKIGFEGEKCDRCSYGYYGYKNCRKCDCNPAGTLQEDCSRDTCRCADQGCRCKANVEGRFCDTCKQGTFGIDHNNPLGCTDCFCFGRSKSCNGSDFTWDQIRTDSLTQDTCINNASCWNLPRKFLGDLTLSYGGYLRLSSNSALPSNFRVFLTGNDITIESTTNDADLKIREPLWQLVHNQAHKKLPSECYQHLSRPCLMTVLQNVTNIKIETGATFKPTEFNEVLLDRATDIHGEPRVFTVERCVCPKEYTSLSCQDPSEGYYRYYPKHGETDNYIDLNIGVARRCFCNNHSNICDPQTGHCQNCTNFTKGPHCENCADGYYKDKSGKCMPCMCPSIKQNFAKSCVPGSKPNQMKCICKEGYTGPKCNECQPKYYGNPHENGGQCQKCKCDKDGSKTPIICDKVTGVCDCKPNFTGKHCSQCVSPREFIKDGLCTPCDECTQILFKTIDDLSNSLNNTWGLFKDGLAPPWKVFNETLYRYKILTAKFDDEMLKAHNLINKVDIDSLENKVKDIEKKLNRTSQDLIRQTKSVDNLLKDSRNISTQVDDLIKRIGVVIGSLNNFGNSHVDTKEALREAQRLLDQIDNLIENTPNANNYRLLFSKCQEVLDRVNRIYKDNKLNPDELRTELSEFKKRLGALNALLDQTELLTKLTKNKNKQNLNRIEKLKEIIKEINAKNSIISSDFMETVRKINATTDILLELAKITELLTDLDLQELSDKLENEVDNWPDLYTILDNVGKHVQHLQDKIKANKNLLNFTNDDWKKINASGAYETLVKGIKDAQNKANEAQKILRDALRLISPDDDDSLLDKTNLAKAYSDRLKKRILNIENKRKDFQDILDRLNDLKSDILQNGRNNNDLTSTLHNMMEHIQNHSDKFVDLQKVKEEASNVSNQMVALEREVKNVNISAQYDLFKTYTKYLDLTSSDKISDLMNKITSTRLSLGDVDANLTRFDFLKNKNQNVFNNSLSNLNHLKNKLAELKNKIQYAKEAADTINVAMRISNCLRQYRIPRDVFTSLSITFKCNSTCNLFELTADGNPSIMRIQVTKNNEIEFKLNGTTRKFPRLTDNITTVTVERIGAIFRVKVDENMGVREDTLFYRNLLKFNEDDLITIGKLTQGRAESGTDACVHKMVLNEQVIGLWNFVATSGSCQGCQKNDTKINDDNILFNGNGYRNVTSASRAHNPIRLTIKLHFTTFDENSLLFLAHTASPSCSYILLTLDDGHLKLMVRHIDGTNVTLTSKKSYNKGQVSTVVVKLAFSGGTQTYNLESAPDDVITELRNLTGSNVFKIKKAETFIGGLPSVVNKTCIPLGETQSFLGYLKSGDPEYEDPVATVSYNTKFQSGPLQFNKAWFASEDGLLELETKENYENPVSISFLLKKPRANSFIMEINEAIRLYLKNNNRLVLEIDNQQLDVKTLSVHEINAIQLNITKDRITTEVNGETDSFDVGLTVSDKINFVIGSDPSKKHSIGYNGGISNIVINEKRFLLNNMTIKSSSKVQIGREKLLIGQSPSLRSASGSSIDTNSIKEMQNTQGCPVIANYETDPDAVKFGDKPHSFVFVENAFWKKDYELEFEFRTFYPNGLLFVAVGAHQQKHYNVLEIQEGKLVLRIKGKRVKLITFPRKINDGMWHRVEISQSGLKKKRKLTFKLDGDVKKPMRIPKNNLKSEMYVGGLPENFLDHIQLSNQLHPFRGCMRSLKINNVLQTLVKNKKSVSYNNIGQCFSNVELGAYFGGDAYAVYRGDFTVNKLLELSFEFKTVEQNGILLSVSNLGNSPALSVELQNGAIVMSIDMGNGAISNVTNSLDSEFILCNNRWHNITALYSTFELTVNVDGIRKSWVQYDFNSLMSEIEAPLYVGGVPENAPTGTLKIKENFKGCIRKLKIDDKLMDWTDMKELNNVLLNACPVVST